MGSVVKKITVLVLLCNMYAQAVQAESVETSYLRHSLLVSARIVGVVSSVGLVWLVCNRMSDYHERTHLQDLEQAVAVLANKAQGTEQAIKRMRSEQERVRAYLDQLNSMQHTSSARQYIAPPDVKLFLVIPSFDSEQRYLNNVIKKWKDRQGYYEYYRRAVFLKDQFERMGSRAEFGTAVAIHNQFVSLYHRLLIVIERHAEAISWFKQDLLAVSHQSSTRQYLYLSYSQILTDDIKELEDIMSEALGVFYYDILYETASLWQRALKDYQTVFLVSDQYRADWYLYNEQIREQGRRWSSSHWQGRLSGTFSPKQWSGNWMHKNDFIDELPPATEIL
jgi:hypothetical protein